MSTGITPIIDRTSLLVVVGLVAGVIVSDQVMYRFLVVPRLTEWQSVPIHQWLIVLLPVVLTGVIGGGYLLRRGQRLVVALLAAIATQGYLTVAALLQSPGHGKSLAIESPTSLWTSGLSLVAVGYVLLLGIGQIIRLVGSARAGA